MKLLLDTANIKDIRYCATIGASIMKMLISHTTTDTSIAGFEADWNRAFGNTTLLKLLKNQ